MQEDMFAPSLMVHRLRGKYQELRACSCSYDCRIIFYLERQFKNETHQPQELTKKGSSGTV
jgi:mRNA interferase YafQ